MLFIYVTKSGADVNGVILPDIIRFKKEVTTFVKTNHAFVYPCVESKEEDVILVKKQDTAGHTGWFVSEHDIFGDAEDDIRLPKEQVKKHKMANANDMNALSIAYCSVKE